MNKLFEKFQNTARTEAALYDLVAADERARPGYGMEAYGFDRFIIYVNQGMTLLQVERYKDGHHNISIQGHGAGYVRFGEDRFMELLKQF